MTGLSAHIERVDDNGLREYDIWYRFNQSDNHETILTPSEAPDMIAQGCRYFQLAGDLTGECAPQSSSSFIRCLTPCDINTASHHTDISYSLADQANNDVRRNLALSLVASCKEIQGKFQETLELAHRAQVLAGRIGNFNRETECLEQEARAWVGLGNFSQAVQVCARVRQLVNASGLDGTMHEISAIDLEADIQLYKTAYPESRRAHEAIGFPLFHGNSLAAIASIDVVLGGMKSEAEVLAALQLPRQIYISCRYLRGTLMCDRIVPNFFLANGRTSEAIELYETCTLAFRGEAADFFFNCMVKLGNINLVHDARLATHGTTACLAHGKTTANGYVVSWALRLLGDIIRHDRNDETAVAEKDGADVAAMQHFAEARRMFVKSGMVAEVGNVSVESA
ncbi:hypothetical protein DFH09DRAFT_1117758 [Mycena vulgaris]|nr:hypothetical protein DFH09DRAFT_1117758 [Mycena vulgaris]